MNFIDFVQLLCDGEPIALTDVTLTLAKPKTPGSTLPNIAAVRRRDSRAVLFQMSDGTRQKHIDVTDGDVKLIAAILRLATGRAVKHIPLPHQSWDHNNLETFTFE